MASVMYFLRKLGSLQDQTFRFRFLLEPILQVEKMSKNMSLKIEKRGPDLVFKWQKFYTYMLTFHVISDIACLY